MFQEKFFIRRHSTETGLCFVLMPFNDKLKSVHEFVIKPFVEKMGMRCVRADDIYSARPIMEDIWTGIQRAEIVIADLTDRNPNVMYELGLCHTLWKKIVLITQNVDDVPFDLKGFRLIPYESSIGGAARLTDELGRAVATLRADRTGEAQIVPLTSAASSSSTPKVSGVVDSVARDYMVIRLDDGREARMKREDFSWYFNLRDLKSRFRAGQQVSGVLLSDSTIPLVFSMKHLHPNPWPQLQKEFPRGKEITGKVVVVSKNGIFVQVKREFRGLLNHNQLPRGKSFTKGMVVKAKINSIKPERHEIRLDYVGDDSYDPWAEAPQKFATGKIYDGVVSGHRKSGILAELEPGIRGLFRIAETQGTNEEWISSFPVGRTLKWEILGVNSEKRQIDLRPYANGQQTN